MIGTKQLHTDSEGYVYDPETGEVLGIVDPGTGEVVALREQGEVEPIAPEKERFEVKSVEAADWVFKLMMEQEAALLSIAAKRLALIANLEGQAVEHRNRLNGLHWRFDRDLETFARAEIESKRGKGKTLKLTFGSIAFRNSAGSSAITDPGKALEFVEEWKPEEIKKSVGVEAVKAAIDEAIRQVGEVETSAFFKRAEPRETVKISTGIQ